jgi:hypothetical protein
MPNNAKTEWLQSGYLGGYVHVIVERKLPHPELRSARASEPFYLYKTVLFAIEELV